MTMLEDRPEVDLGALPEALTEEECYLAAILMDLSGIDQAEFLWPNHTADDGCFRLYPYQWPWWSELHEKEVEQGARDTGKSERICARACAFNLNFPGEEHALVAPEGEHLNRLTSRIETRIKSVWLLLELVQGGARGITHRPFNIAWSNGARTYSVLPQRSGIGVKGVHAVWLDIDEAQDVPENAWRELPMTVRREVKGHRETAHGVSKGVRTDTFYKITQPRSGWHVTRVTQLHKPTYDPDNRDNLVKAHGGSDTSGDFVRNVYGEHGDTQNRIFVLHHFMASVDERNPEDSDVNGEYYQPIISADEVAERVGSHSAVEISSEEATLAIQQMLEFPITHTSKYKTFWAGMDVGLVGDPTEICVMAEYVPDKREREMNKKLHLAVPDEDISRFRLVTRIRVLQVPEPLLADLVMWVIDFYKPKAFAMDAGGNGLGCFQELQKRAGRSRTMIVEPPELEAGASDQEKIEHEAALKEFEQRKAQAQQALTVIKGYKFGQKLLVEFDEEKVAELGPNPAMKDMIDKAGVLMESKTRSTNVLRTILDNRRFQFPDDVEFIDQMNGQTFNWSTEPMDAFGNRRAVYSKGVFHILDAMRFFALGWSQEQIERIVSAQVQKKPVLDRFVSY